MILSAIFSSRLLGTTTVIDKIVVKRMADEFEGESTAEDTLNGGAGEISITTARMTTRLTAAKATITVTDADDDTIDAIIGATGKGSTVSGRRFFE